LHKIYSTENGFLIQTLFCISVFTNKSYCVTTIYSLSILQNNVFLRRMNNLIQTNCVLPRCIFKTILWLCSPWPSNVYWRFSKHVSILQGYKKRTIFVVGKCSLPENWQVSRLRCKFLFSFQLNENTNTCTVKSEHSDCISHPNTHVHTLNIYVYIFSELIIGILD